MIVGSNPALLFFAILASSFIERISNSMRGRALGDSQEVAGSSPVLFSFYFVFVNEKKTNYIMK